MRNPPLGDYSHSPRIIAHASVLELYVECTCNSSPAAKISGDLREDCESSNSEPNQSPRVTGSPDAARTILTLRGLFPLAVPEVNTGANQAVSIFNRLPAGTVKVLTQAFLVGNDCSY